MKTNLELEWNACEENPKSMSATRYAVSGKEPYFKERKHLEWMMYRDVLES